MVLRLVVVLGVLLLVDVLGHAYLHARLVRAPRWSPAVRRGLSVLVVTMAVVLPAGIVGSVAWPRPIATPIAFVAFVWMGLAFYLVAVLGLLDVVSWVARLAPSARGRASGSHPDEGRRAFVAQTAALAATGTATGLSGIALRSGLSDPQLVEVPVRLERLPRALSGLTLVQLSDVHVGPTIGKGFIDLLVERVNALRPDAVVITGDLVDGSVAALIEHVAPLGRLRSRYGTFFVTGNHEVYSGLEPWVAALEGLGIRTLRDARVRLGDAGGHVDLMGIDDWSIHRGRAERARAALLAGADPEVERILLAHQPQSISEAVALDAGLQLSGHTHGGQLFPFSALVALTTPYLAGLHRHPGATAGGREVQIYVSKGTGYWGPPMRLLAPAEITKIVLV